MAMKQNDLISFLEDPDVAERNDMLAAKQAAAASTPEAIARKETEAKKNAALDAITKQILGQNLTSKWTGAGFGSAEANAKDMAKILSGIGITDIKQFGKVDKYEPVQAIGHTLNGKSIQNPSPGVYYEMVYEGESENGPEYRRRDLTPKEAEQVKTTYGKPDGTDSDGNTVYSAIDPSKVEMRNGVPMAVTGTTFGNKVTGQEVPNTYSERQTGNFFGGTFEGKGNTGYGVQFDSQGNPIFYTQGASSSDLGKIAPLLSIASFIPGVAPFAQGLNALIAAKQGNILGAIAGAAGLGNMAGISGMADIANAAKFAGALKSGDPLAIAMAGANAGGISDIGGVDLKDISKTIGAVKAIESGDPLAILRYGMGALPKGDGLTSSIGPGNMDDFRQNLISGYFQPGGEGYTAPSGGESPMPSPDDDFMPTFPLSSGDYESVFDPTFGGTMPMPSNTSGYYDEITGEFIPGEGPLQGPLGPETGNLDPDKEWEYNLVRPGVWANKDGEEIDVSYMPDRGTAQTGGEIMRNAGAMPGGGKPAAKPGAKPAAPTARPGARPGTAGTAGNPAVDAIANLASQQQQQQNSLLNMMMNDKTEGAKIKSYKELFGEDLFGGNYVPPSALGAGDGFSGMPMAMPMPGMGQEQDAGDDGFSNGGRVNSTDVDTLLQILRG